MQLRVSEQLSIGAWLSMAAAFGIMSRSVETASSTLIVGAVFTAPMFAARGVSSANKALRWLSRAIIFGVAAFLLVGLLSTIERVYLVNGKTYPRWLARGELGRVDDAALGRLRATDCKNDPIEIFQKDGFVVLRCGFAWYEPSTKTFIADSYDFGGKR